jgi:tetratricopeptide (TPR) repeat protein
VPRAAGYFAFISYSHRDSSCAAWLHKALETYRVPRRLVGQGTNAGAIPARLLPIFRDRDELATATDLGRTVNDALARSANLIVICSPHAATSRWVNAEVLAFKRLGRSERIFCLIVDGEPNASTISGREVEECLAPALRYNLGADGELTREPTEPIAADLRAGKDGRANAKLKLIAGMLDVGFDALKRRELQRRNRRMAAVTGLATAVTIVTAILAVSAIIARNDAQRHQRQAEDLVGFMLGDLGDKLGEVHRLDIMQAVDDKAMSYFSSLPTKDVTDASLAQRVTALEKIGSVRMDQGQIPLAIQTYQAASILASDLVHRAPGELTRKAAYADSLKWIGQAYWYQGDLGAALKNFQQASAILQETAAASPGNAEFAEKLGHARNDVGHVLEARGDFDAAKTEYEAVRAIRQGLVDRQPGNASWQKNLGDAYNNLGSLALEQGRLDQAIASYRTDQHVKAVLVMNNPGNHEVQEALVSSTAILGRTLALCGELEAAVSYLRQAVYAAKQLAAFDSKDANYQEYVGLYSQQLGGLLRQIGQTEAANTADAEAIQVLGALVGKDGSSHYDWVRELAQTRLEAARLKLHSGETGAAGELAETASQATMDLLARNPADRRLALLAAQTFTVLGEIAARTGNTESARRWWEQARGVIDPALQVGDDPNFLAAASTASILLDELDVARPLVVRLEAMGYRTPDFEAVLASKRYDYIINASVSQRIAEKLQ